MIDLKTINERLAKAKEDVLFWERAKALFLDPRISGQVEPPQAPQTLPLPIPLAITPRPYGELKRRVLEALPDWGQQPVTTNDLVATIEASGYTFVSKTPAVSVNEALVTLEAEGLSFMVVKQGITRFWTKMQPPREDGGQQ